MEGTEVYIVTSARRKIPGRVIATLQGYRGRTLVAIKPHLRSDLGYGGIGCFYSKWSPVSSQGSLGECPADK